MRARLAKKSSAKLSMKVNQQSGQNQPVGGTVFGLSSQLVSPSGSRSRRGNWVNMPPCSLMARWRALTRLLWDRIPNARGAVNTAACNNQAEHETPQFRGDSFSVFPCESESCAARSSLECVWQRHHRPPQQPMQPLNDDDEPSRCCGRCLRYTAGRTENNNKGSLGENASYYTLPYLLAALQFGAVIEDQPERPRLTKSSSRSSTSPDTLT